MWRSHLGCLARLSDLAGVVLRQLLPAGDGAHAKPGLAVIGDEREVATQLDDARQLAPVLAGAADRFGGWFIDGEHADTIRPHLPQAASPFAVRTRSHTRLDPARRGS